MKFVNTSICQENIKSTTALFKRCPTQITNSIVNTVKYDVATLPLEKGQNNCSVTIENEDVADVGLKLKKEGLNPVIINMASDLTPGGGWRNGSIAQEESLFYRSLYYLSLEDPWKLNKNSSSYYPLKPLEQIYTPDVYFFRSKQGSGFQLLEEKECFHLPCVAVAAIRRPVLSGASTGSPNGSSYLAKDRQLMKEKIMGVLKIAVLNKHDSIVLSALGCGAFGNPPEQVAEIFKEVLDEFKGNFKRVVFAILDFGQSQNEKIFRKVLLSD